MKNKNNLKKSQEYYNSYSYYKTAYRARVRYAKKVGKEIYTDMLTKEEFENGLKDSSVKELVDESFYVQDLSTYQKLKEAGLKFNRKEKQDFLEYGDLSRENTELLSNAYNSYKGTHTGKEAALYISQTFFGSN